MSEQDRDSFWDIEKLIPKKSTSGLSAFSSKEKLTEIDIPSSDAVPEDKERFKLTQPERSDEDEISYTPSAGLLKRVTIRRIKEKYDFHANFVKAAELYFDFKAPKCDFVPFFSYMPQYTQLNQAQKNFYFYWRSEVRSGRFPKTDNSYFYLLVYEIINLPHLVLPSEGLVLLVDLWREYRGSLSGIDSNMALWVQDYCLIHRLECPMDKIRDFVFTAVGASGFKEFYLSDAETLSPKGTSSVLAYLSDYDWRSGKYANGENKEPYERHLTGAMSLIVSRLLLGGRIISDEGSTARLERTAFRSALTTSAVKYRICVEYRPIAEQTDLRVIVTAAIKYTENRLRALMGVKSRLAIKGLPDEYKSVIDSYFGVYFDKVNRERARSARPEYEKNYEVEREELSFADADEIERASWTTTARLVEDAEEYRVLEPEAPPLAPQHEQAAREGADSYGLSAEHISFISAALKADFDELRAIAERASALADSMADEINESFADGFGDVILEPSEEGYRIIDDYIEDVTEWLSKIQK